MNEYILPSDFVDQSVRLEVHLSIGLYANPIELGWYMTPLGKLDEVRAVGL